MEIEKIRNEVLATDEDVIYEFKSNLEHQIEDFCKKFKILLENTKDFNREINNKRHAIIEMLLLNSFNSLLISMKLLIRGLLVPSGNLIRIFYESMCIALLSSTEKLNIFERIDENPNTFSFQKAPTYLNKKKNIELLGLDEEAIKKNDEIKKFYDKYSHGTYFSNFTFYNTSKNNEPYLGSFYDKGKDEIYEIEFTRRCSACDLLIEIIGIIIKLQN